MDQRKPNMRPAANGSAALRATRLTDEQVSIAEDTKRFYGLRPLPVKPTRPTSKQTPKAPPPAAKVMALPVQSAP